MKKFIWFNNLFYFFLAEVGLLATVVYTLAGFVDLVVASAGDKSWTFNRCLKECHAANCSAEGNSVF